MKKTAIFIAALFLLSKQVSADPTIQENISRLADCKSNNCDWVKKQLVAVGNSCVDELLSKLGGLGLDEKWEIQIIEVLGQIRDKRAIEPLKRELNKSGVSSRFRTSIIGALGRIGDINSIEVLQNELKGSDTDSAFMAYLGVVAIEESQKSPKLDLDEIPRDWVTNDVMVLTIRDKRRYVVVKHKLLVLEEKRSPLDLSLWPRVKFPSGQISNVRGLSLGVYNLTASVYGVQAGIANIAHGNSVAVQVGAANNVDGKFSGLQAAVLGNHVNGRLYYGVQVGIAYNIYGNFYKERGYGIQVAMFNMDEGELEGLQAGLLNLNIRPFKGLQIGIVNIAESLDGVQLGLLNGVGDMIMGGGNCRGLQVGLFNGCGGTLHGVQLGVFNHAESNALPWSIGLNAGF